MAAAKYAPGNLTAIVDYNGVQLDGTNDEVMPLGDLQAKWSAFGWRVISCDGHKVEEVLSALEAALPALGAQADWSNEGLYECLTGLAQRLEVKNSVVLWPVRVAVSGRQSTPGGATDLCSILGKEESLSRIRRGIDLLRSR